MAAATAKVSRHIPDIAPTLTLRRDKTYPTYPANRKRIALPRMEVIREIEPSYSWNQLPDLCGYKSAIVRSKVCEGLMYLLPGNKNGASMARPYTADLGAMFHEPYLSFKPNEYNEENVRESSNIHFSPNTHISRLKRYGEKRDRAHNINSESRKKYQNYSLLVTSDSEKEKRASDNRPVVAKVGKAEEELQQEVQNILDEVGVQTVREESEEGDSRPYSSIFNNTKSRHNSDSNNQVSEVIESNNKSGLLNGKTRQQKVSQSESESSRSRASKIQDYRQHQYVKKSAKFKDFKELRETEVPKPELPDQLKSEYLSEEKIQEIWSWLHWDFKKSKLEYFIEVCS
ncbi:hypothetical protein EB796_009134 [Bugula neritina]|uniref:Uncharacterized protein n=1 Tax=Bugula neritina TaxID=10212 RepID=A0A7J7K2W3_BUGNE|nr:hypothetical protein EB796_009134 [Bugula neritina]